MEGPIKLYWTYWEKSYFLAYNNTVQCSNNDHSLLGTTTVCPSHPLNVIKPTPPPRWFYPPPTICILSKGHKRRKTFSLYRSDIIRPSPPLRPKPWNIIAHSFLFKNDFSFKVFFLPFCCLHKSFLGYGSGDLLNFLMFHPWNYRISIYNLSLALLTWLLLFSLAFVSFSWPNRHRKKCQKIP